MNFLPIIRDAYRKSVEKRHFSEAIYLRHHSDLRIGMEAAGFASGYDHFGRHGRGEGRRRTYRRLRPGQAVTFPMTLPARALSGLQLMLGVECAEVSDLFSLTLVDRGRAVYRRSLPFGCVAVDRATDILTGPITGLSETVTVRLEVDALARNDLWLMTAAGDASPKTAFAASPFFDDPDAAGSDSLALILSPVSQCNQNCPHCISNATRKKFSRYSPKTQAEIRNLANRNRIRIVSIDYSGDAFFTNSRYFPIFDFLDELGCRFRIDTNGAYVDEETMRRVARGRLVGINFSLDAATAETHSRLRPGKIGFDAILKNIRRAVAILEEEGRNDVMTSANMALMRANVGEALAFVDLCHALGLKNVVFSQMGVYQDDTASESLAHEPDRYNEVVDGLIASAMSKGLGFSIPPAFVPGLESSGRTRCVAPWSSAVILANGDVQACCVPGSTIGSLAANTFEEVWQSQTAKAFRMQAASPGGEICGRCAFNGHRGIRQAGDGRDSGPRSSGP